jgi:hypothetical protein
VQWLLLSAGDWLYRTACTVQWLLLSAGDLLLHMHALEGTADSAQACSAARSPRLWGVVAFLTHCCEGAMLVGHHLLNVLCKGLARDELLCNWAGVAEDGPACQVGQRPQYPCSLQAAAMSEC